MSALSGMFKAMAEAEKQRTEVMGRMIVQFIEAGVLPGDEWGPKH